MNKTVPFRSVLRAALLLLLLGAVLLPGVTSAQSTTVAFDMVNSTSQNLLSHTNPFVDAWGAGDAFQKLQRGVNETPFGLPFAIADDSAGSFPPDDQGIIGVADTEEFFGVVDTVNSDNPSGSAEATWVFDIAGASNLVLSIDMAAMGDFESSDDFVWSYSIDGAPFQVVFQSSVDEAGSQTYTMDSGTVVPLNDPLLVNGVLLNDVRQPISANLSGSGSQLTLKFEATANGGSEAYVASDIVIRSQPQNPAVEIVKEAAAGGDSQDVEQGQVASFSITVTNTGDVDLTNVAVSDPLAPACDNAIGTLAVGADTTYTCDSPAVTGDFTNTATVTSDEGATDSDTSAVNVQAPLVGICEIQGAAHTTPYDGQEVRTRGIVTALKSNGYFIQDPNCDALLETSDGMFVFTGGNSFGGGVAIGDELEITDAPNEFFNLTQMSFPDTTILSTGNALPAAVLIGSGGRQIPSTFNIDNDGVTSFDINEDALDFYESLEGMRVYVAPNAGVVGPTNRFDEFLVVQPDAVVGSPTGVNARGGITISSGDFNPERIMVDGDILDTPEVSVGDTITTPIEGVMDYTFSNYKIQITQGVQFLEGNLPEEVSTVAVGGDYLTIASYNVLNLDPGDGSQFDELAADIVVNLACPDIIGLQEVQDNSGPTDDGVVDASMTYQMLIDAVAAASSGLCNYDYRDIAPLDGQDGGQPGGNIRVGFLFRPDRVTFVDRGNAGPTDATQAVNGFNGLELSLSPGRIDPTSFVDSRKPLAGEFVFQNNRVFVVVHHFNSKFGDDPLYGLTQPPFLGSEAERIVQANAVNNFVASLLALDPNANIAVLGDTNDFYFSTPTNILEQNLVNLVESLPETERYSYIFEGNSQNLDNFLISSTLVPMAQFDIVHINAEYAAQTSDHDPLIASFDLPPVAPLCNGVPATIWVDADGNIQSDDDYYGGLRVPRDGRPANGRIVGTDRPDVIVGTDGDDRIVGRANDDLICGYGGNDVIVGQDGADEIYAGDGDDTVNAGNSQDRVWGGDGNDTIRLGGGDDYAEGSAGDDVISGSHGQDELYGQAGSDLLNGGDGDDELYGGDDADRLVGGNGNDDLDGGAGDENRASQVGDDRTGGIFGGNGDDTLFGGDGDDELFGQGNNDTLSGDAGDDVLFGSNGDDTLSGGDDNDICRGQGGPHDTADDTCETANAEH